MYQNLIGKKPLWKLKLISMETWPMCHTIHKDTSAYVLSALCKLRMKNEDNTCSIAIVSACWRRFYCWERTHFRCMSSWTCGCTTIIQLVSKCQKSGKKSTLLNFHVGGCVVHCIIRLSVSAFWQPMWKVVIDILTLTFDLVHIAKRLTQVSAMDIPYPRLTHSSKECPVKRAQLRMQSMIDFVG